MSAVARAVVPPLVVGVAGVAVWQLLVGVGHLPAYVAPSPAQVVRNVGSSWGLMRPAMRVTGTNALTGLVAGALWAALVAVVAHAWRPASTLFGTLAAGAAAVPIVALAPLCYGAFSATGEFPRRLVVAVAVFFPIYVNVAKGLGQVSAQQGELFYCNAASWWETTRRLRIPTALPYLFTGLRIAAPSAVITSVVTEYFGGGQNGLATLISTAAASSSYAQAWAFVLGSVLLGLIAFLVTAGLELLVQRRLGVTSARRS